MCCELYSIFLQSTTYLENLILLHTLHQHIIFLVPLFSRRNLLPLMNQSGRAHFCTLNSPRVFIESNIVRIVPPAFKPLFSMRNNLFSIDPMNDVVFG